MPPSVKRRCSGVELLFQYELFNRGAVCQTRCSLPILNCGPDGPCQDFGCAPLAWVVAADTGYHHQQCNCQRGGSHADADYYSS